MYGIDVSEYAQTVDWAAVRTSGKTFAFIRATEGSSIKDKTFERNWSVAKMNSIIRGAYHFFHPLTSDPVKQAQEFLKTMGPLQPGDLPPVLDVEVSDGASAGTIVNKMKQWLAEVETTLQQQTGKPLKPFIYTSPNFWNNILGDPNDFASYPLWIAHYGVTNPSIPSSWGADNWSVHQYQGSVANIPGVSGLGDLNLFNLLQKGSKGPRVEELQQQLKALQTPEFDPGDIDGDFGQLTENAVVAFQTSKQLDADGIVGPKTWVTLLWA